MSKSAIYVVNTTAGSTIGAGSAYPLTQVVRRFGSDISANGTGVTCKTPGYYKVSGTFTVTAAAAGTITAALFNNGTQVTGAISEATVAADDIVTLPINAIVRVNCCGNPADLSVVINGGASESVNAELTAVKL